MAAFAVPAAAQADTVDVHIESFGAPLVPHTKIVLPTTPLLPAGGADGQTCPGNSVVAAVDKATSGGWSGTYVDASSGWSIERIKGVAALIPDGRKWVTLVNGFLYNDSPCQLTLKDGDQLTMYPACLPGTSTKCFAQGPLYMNVPQQAGPGAPIHITVYQTLMTLDSTGVGSSQRQPAGDAAVAGPENSTLSDSYYGTGEAILTVQAKGPADFSASKSTFVPETGHSCVTDGHDGYCGTPAPDPVPFDPYAFCQTTGNDGYCNSPDQVAPVGHIATPVQATTFAKKGPTELRGTVDFDPSLTDHVNLRMMRQITVTVKKYKKKKVWKRVKVKGKTVRKRVTKRIPYKVKQKACYYWSDSASDWKKMKKCDPATALQWRAEGAEIWKYSFLNNLPVGNYVLDALAVDGAGNQDASMEVGRNRVTFKVS